MDPMDRGAEKRAAPGTHTVSLTRAPERPDGARGALLPTQRYASLEELRRALPDVAGARADGRLFGPTWSGNGTRYAAEFATYGAFGAAFPDVAERIRMRGSAPAGAAVPDVRLVVHVAGPIRAL